MLDYYLKSLCDEQKQLSLQKRAADDEDKKKLQRQLVYGIGGMGTGALVNHLLGNRSWQSYALGAGAGGVSGLVLESLLNPKKKSAVTSKDKAEEAKEKRAAEIMTRIQEVEDKMGRPLTDDEREALFESSQLGGSVGHFWTMTGAGAGGVGTAVMNYRNRKDSKKTQKSIYSERNAGDPDADKILDLETETWIQNNPNAQRVQELRRLERDAEQINLEQRAYADAQLNAQDYLKTEEARAAARDAILKDPARVADYQKAEADVANLEAAIAKNNADAKLINDAYNQYRKDPAYEAALEKARLADTGTVVHTANAQSNNPIDMNYADLKRAIGNAEHLYKLNKYDADQWLQTYKLAQQSYYKTPPNKRTPQQLQSLQSARTAAEKARDAADDFAKQLNEFRAAEQRSRFQAELTFQQHLLANPVEIHPSLNAVTPLTPDEIQRLTLAREAVSRMQQSQLDNMLNDRVRFEFGNLISQDPILSKAKIDVAKYNLQERLKQRAMLQSQHDLIRLKLREEIAGLLNSRHNPLGKLEHGPNPHSGVKGKVHNVGKGGARLVRTGFPAIVGTLLGYFGDTVRQWNRDRNADDIMTRAEWEERQRGK